MSKVKQFILVLIPALLISGECAKDDAFLYCIMSNAFITEFSCVNGILIPGVPPDCVCNCNEGWMGDRCDVPVDGGGHPNNRDGGKMLSQIQFENQSTTAVSYDVILDDTWITSIPSGGKSESLEVETGKHHVVFRITGTSIRACLNDDVFLEPGKKLILRCNT